jgi:hypothetical protein
MFRKWQLIIMSVPQLNKIDDDLWEIPRDHRADMRVPARIYAD